MGSRNVVTKIILLALMGCSSMSPDLDVIPFIRKHGLGASWEHERGFVRIWCEGEFAYKYKPLFGEETLFNKSTDSEKGGRIMKISLKSFKIGPFLGREYHLDKLPYLNKNNKWAIQINGIEFEKVQDFDCQ